MPVLDTNCLLRWLMRDHPDMTAKVDALLASGQRFRVPDVALIETVYVLESFYRFNRSEVSQAIRLVISQTGMETNRALWSDVVDAYERHSKLSCTDVFLAMEARMMGDGPLYSFDHKLVTQLEAVSP